MNIIIIIFIILLVVGLAYRSKAQSQGDFTNITILEIDDLLKTNPAIEVLDVRTTKETTGGKIKNAKEINVLSPSFSTKIEALDKSKSYLVYCRSGSRSVKACNIMSKKGFEKLYNLKGGYNAWLKEGK